MRLLVNVLGAFELRLDGQPLPFRQPSQRIVRCLAFATGPVSRRDLIAVLYPEADDSVAKNRLRVSLSNLRSLLGTCLVEAPEGIGFDRQQTVCDAWSLRAGMAEAADCVDRRQEIEAATLALEQVPSWQGLVEGGPECDGLKDELGEFCLRVCQLSIELGVPELTQIASGLARSLAPENPDAWATYLRLQHMLGNSRSAVRELKSSRSSVANDPLVLQVLAEIRASPASVAARQIDKSSQLLLDIFAALEDRHPQQVLTVLAQPACLPLSGKYPREMCELLTRTLALDVEHDEAWERCTARLAGLQAWLGNADACEAAARQLLEQSQNPIVLRATWNALSVAYSLRRDWPAAHHAIDRTMEFARLAGDAIGVLSAMGNGASYLMHECKFVEADEQYARSLEQLLAFDTVQAKFDHAIGYGNMAFVPVFSGDYEEAKKRLTTGIRIREQVGTQAGLMLGALVYVCACLDEPIDIRMARRSLVEAIDSNSHQMVHATMEYLACALAECGGSGFAKAVLDRVADWRSASGPARSAAETALCRRHLRHSAEPVTIPPKATPDVVGREILRRLRLIQESAKTRLGDSGNQHF